LLSQKTGADLNVNDLKQLIGREINNCLQPGRHPSESSSEQLSKLSAAEQLSKLSSTEQLPKLSSDVTLTKVAAPERLAEKEKEPSKVCAQLYITTGKLKKIDLSYQC
jgi:hypothetical protein